MEDKEYTTDDKVAEFLGEALSTDISALILAVQAYIDNVTGRNFKADEVASARLYDGNDEDSLTIDDCIAITKVESGNDAYGDSFTEVLATGSDRYYTLPNNALALGYPIIQIALRSGYFLEGVQNQRITAKWGYSEEVPSDISWVATFLSASLYKKGVMQNLAGISSENIGAYAVSYGGEQVGNSDWDKAQVILNSYKKYSL